MLDGLKNFFVLAENEDGELQKLGVADGDLVGLARPLDHLRDGVKCLNDHFVIDVIDFDRPEELSCQCDEVVGVL